VINGTASNQDGRTVNIATPSEEAQTQVYRDAIAVSGIDAATIGMVEAHGTGTPVGDPIEYASLASVYGIEGPCVLGSVKTNFGHTQSASGALGLMKTVLALEHGVVPKNLNYTQLPDKLAEISTNLFVPQENTPFPEKAGIPRRAAVSAYGISGTNAHVIVEQAPATAETGDSAKTADADELLLFPLSSSSAEELRVTAGRLADWVEGPDSNSPGPDIRLSDLAYTLARRRAHRPVRTVVSARNRDDLIAALREVEHSELPYPAAVGMDDRGPVWVFSGQGSQWANMGADLLAGEPVFAATIAAIEPIIQRESGFSVTEAMTGTETVTGIDRVQPTIFAMQVAIAETMKSYGVRPGAVIGHSLGESAAAVVAGALSLEDGLKVICRRSQLMKRISGSGSMAAVELPGPQVLSELSIRGMDNVVLSVVASPTSTVVGGDTGSIRELVAAWEKNDVMAREVAVDVASHSPQVEPILEDLLEALADLEPREPEVPYYSSTLWDPRDQPSFDADYWSDNLRYTVRFASAVQAALSDGFRVFGELAPHPLLTHAVEQNAASLDMPIAALAAMRREQDLPLGLRGFVGDIHAAGAAVDFEALFPTGALTDAPLPTWTRRDLILNRASHDQAAQGGPVLAVHPLLGAHVHLVEEPARDVWQGEVGTEAHPWLADHQIYGVATFPGAAYCEMALAAAHTTIGQDSEVRDIRFEQALLLDDVTAISVSATVDVQDSLAFLVETHEEGGSTGRAAAVLHAVESTEEAPVHDVTKLLAEHTSSTDGDDVRSAFDSIGIHYGPAFSGLRSVHTAENDVTTVLSEVALPGSIRSQQSAYGIHPALLDACFQSVVVHPAVQEAGLGGILLPVGVRRLRLYQQARNAHYCFARAHLTRPGEIEADIDVMDEAGTVLLRLEGLRLSAGVSENEQANRKLNERLLAIAWDQRELPATTQSGSWLVLGISDAAEPLARSITEALSAAGEQPGTMARAQLEQFSDAAKLRAKLGSTSIGEGFAGVVVVTAPPASETGEAAAHRGRDYVGQLITIAQELAELPGEPPRLYLVTRNASTVDSEELANLEQTGLRGLMRVIDSEHPHLSATTIDIDAVTDPALIARQISSGSEEDETAWRAGTWFTARLLPSPFTPDDRRSTVVDAASGGMRLEIRNPGDMESLEFTAFDRVPPEAGQIEIAVTASSINFADVLVAFGRYPTFEGYRQQLGIDFAGVVTAVGPGVTEHKVGDHVGGISPNGCWSTFVLCDARHAVTLPAGIPLEEAAAVPAVSATAWYSLHDLARITPSDKVLIHSGSGGVGHVAIAIARAVGCEIFATAGSPERRQVLTDMGIEHVYDSRSLDFADEIRRDTGGYGVDVVLNSLPGAAQRIGLELLAFGGRFVEIGKRDIYGDTKLGLFPFRRNLSLYAVDLGLLTASHPAVVNRLLTTVYEKTAEGVLPLPPTTHFPISDAADAIRLVGGARHTGKVLLDVSHHGESRAVLPPEQVPVFRSDGAYIVTGGLGGLGLYLAEGMAAGHCGRIVLNSRSAPTAEAQAAIDRMRAGGADVQVVSADIADLKTAELLVAVATETGLPVRGVLHAAAVVEDAVLTNITDDLIDRCWGAKVYGAWNLHDATVRQPLDWFCLFSSAAALVGSPGQGAYSAANSWLDGFSRWRHAQGLPSTSIAWGAWAQIGRGTALAEDVGVAISPDEGAQAFETLLRYDRPYSGYAPLMGTAWLTAFAKRSKFAEAFQSVGTGKADGGKFLSELKVMPREEWPGAIRRLVSDQISLLLRRSIDPDRPLSDYGLDSLGNLELRTRVEAELGVRISPTQITTVRGLADHLCQQLEEKEGIAGAAG